MSVQEGVMKLKTKILARIERRKRQIYITVMFVFMYFILKAILEILRTGKPSDLLDSVGVITNGKRKDERHLVSQ